MARVQTITKHPVRKHSPWDALAAHCNNVVKLHLRKLLRMMHCAACVPASRDNNNLTPLSGKFSEE